MGSRRKPVVLIVEEEALLRLAASDMVEEAGFAAVEARDAGQALSLLEARGDVAVVFADLDLSGRMGGLALARSIEARWPRVGLIFTASSGTPAATALPEGSRFFAKPYSDRAVLEAVADLVD